MKSLRVALVQLSAGTDVDENLVKVEELLGTVRNVDLVALPEVFSVRGEHDDYVNNAEPIPGPTTERLSRVANQLGAWILAGSVIEKSDDGIYNTSVLLDRTGTITCQYRKIHLFEATLDNGQVIRESDTYRAGNKPVLADIEEWKCGMSICYDLRFPEIYRQYALQEAQLLFVPANFTQRTGRDHWETLVRARAIENQCFVVAPDQCGTNPSTGVVSHGHSMVVGPWGEILCRADDTESVTVVELDPKEITETRARIPVIEHRKLL